MPFPPSFLPLCSQIQFNIGIVQCLLQCLRDICPGRLPRLPGETPARVCTNPPVRSMGFFSLLPRSLAPTGSETGLASGETPNRAAAERLPGPKEAAGQGVRREWKSHVGYQLPVQAVSKYTRLLMSSRNKEQGPGCRNAPQSHWTRVRGETVTASQGLTLVPQKRRLP